MSIASPPRRIPEVHREPAPLPTTALHSAPRPKTPRVSPRRDMNCSLGDVASFSIMVGSSETYFSAFALALGTGQTFAGLLATLPQLGGAAFQLISPWGVRWLGSHRRWVVLFAALQAAALLLLPLASFFTGGMAGLLVFLAVTLYWGAGLAGGPAWNTWMEEIVPRPVRTNFFAYRARVAQFCTMLGFIFGGVALQVGHAGGTILATYCAVFGIGAFCRFMSALFLNQHSEPSRGRVVERRVTLRELLARRSSDATGRLVLYLLAVQMVVQISGPYFGPYMLKDLLANDPLKYFNFMLLIATCFLGKVLAMPFWGRVARATGPRRLLWVGGAAIIPISGLWIFADFLRPYNAALHYDFAIGSFEWTLTVEFAYLLAIQLISGMVWAAYELAMALMFFEAIPRIERTSVLALYNFGNAVALVAGSLIGAAILLAMHESHAAYLTLFGLSSVLRVGTFLLLCRTRRKERKEAAR